MSRPAALEVRETRSAAAGIVDGVGETERRILGLGEAEDHHRISAYVVSFPKCGRTWLRMLLAHAFAEHFGVAVTPEIGDQHREKDGVPWVHFTHCGASREDFRERRLDFGVFATKKVIYLVRDPRDIIVSYHFQTVLREPRRGVRMEMSAFLRDPVYGMPRVVEMLNRVAANRDAPGEARTYSYEGMKRSAVGVLGDVLEFLELDIPAASIDRAVAACSFAALRRAEAEGRYDHDSMQPGDPRDPRSFKMREGEVGGFRRHLDAADITYLDTYLASHLDPIYEEYLRGCHFEPGRKS